MVGTVQVLIIICFDFWNVIMRIVTYFLMSEVKSQDSYTALTAEPTLQAKATRGLLR